MTLKGFHNRFQSFFYAARSGHRRLVHLGRSVAGEPVYRAGAIWSFVAAIGLIVYGVWFYRKMKKSRIITMKARLILLLMLFIGSPIAQALVAPFVS